MTTEALDIPFPTSASFRRPFRLSAFLRALRIAGARRRREWVGIELELARTNASSRSETKRQAWLNDLAQTGGSAFLIIR